MSLIIIDGAPAPSKKESNVKILQPPELEHDAMMAERFGTEVSPQGRRERRIVWNLLKHLEAAGFVAFAIDDGDAGVVLLRPAGDPAKAAMELIFNLDDATLYVRSAEGRQHWINLVLGNDLDLISDYGIPDVPDGFIEAMDAFDVEVLA